MILMQSNLFCKKVLVVTELVEAGPNVVCFFP